MKVATREEAVAVIRASKQSINRYMLDRTVTIVSHDDVDYLDHGSGVLLQLEEAHVILTAGHVIMKKPPQQLQIIADERMTNDRFAPVAKARRGGKKLGSVDVGYLRLDPADLGRLSNKKFLKLTDLQLYPLNLSTDLVLLQGVPDVIRTEEEPGRHIFQSYAFFSTLDRDVDWTRRRPIQLEIPYPSFIVNALSDELEELPDPEGMSGGGMWQARYGGDTIWTTGSLRLVGIIVEIKRTNRVVPVNTLSSLVDLLAKKFPSARQFLRDQHALLKGSMLQVKKGVEVASQPRARSAGQRT